MKIYLFLRKKLVSFLLPSIVSGEFLFDEFEDSESKLINICAKDGKWCLMSTSSTYIVLNNQKLDSVYLDPNHFYTLVRNKIQYLIYVIDISSSITALYNIKTYSNFNISNNTGNIKLNIPVKDIGVVNFNYIDNHYVIESNSNFLYLNNIRVGNNKITLSYGDYIDILNLKLIYLPNLFIIICDPLLYQCNIFEKSNILVDQIEDFEVLDRDLYKENDYYFKSPRLKRTIDTYEVKLTKPPVSNNDNNNSLLLTLGPMITMGLISAVNFANVIIRITKKQSNFSNEWGSLLTSGAMLVSMIVWPMITRWFTKKVEKERRKKVEKKYTSYLNDIRKKLDAEVKYQTDVIYENLLSSKECKDVIIKRSYNFWDKKLNQDDFLDVRLGIGTTPFDVKIEYSIDDFTMDEDNLLKQADRLVEEYKKLNNVPQKYSFYLNKVTAIMGVQDKVYYFLNNLLIQLLCYYTYDDLKFIVFTDNNNKYLEYMKYLNYTFNNSKNIRFYASDQESRKNISEFLYNEYYNRLNNYNENNSSSIKPYYIIIIDDYKDIKKYDIFTAISENSTNLGFSLIFLEQSFSNLPSGCNNFISLGIDNKSTVLSNAYDNQEQNEFIDEIDYSIDMMEIAKILSNIPIKFQKGESYLPESISFLSMERVGRVEQLNILNRWNISDPTMSLRAEVGVDENSDLIYLDLHEKAHGPHGLIAGTTGSGKSEFIMTYILSMCINYSPDIVSFIIIDYKGGGLALAFENKQTGVRLPHLAGTITNLDKAEMERTLVSIDSEVKRRQQLFNKARDITGEGTIDIYKYQKYYLDGKFNEPVPHLFIICDEFAELKSQQPEFMDNLISVARIGRSLGVHLILATQKPSGVVNDQIWSNSRFKVCLKVQDIQDSKEVLKKEDAAYLKQPGRFYLQVGLDEYYILGQSGFCGAKYYPKDEMVKEVDKTINFISDSGIIIKNLLANSQKQTEAVGEQFNFILENIIECAKNEQKYSKKLWLDNINQEILLKDIKEKYNKELSNYDVIIGEYDAPEMQYQDLVIYNYLNNGNTIIYGTDGLERESLLNALIVSTIENYDSKQINFYIIDYGSESLQKYNKIPHIGDVIIAGEDEKLKNFLKFIDDEIKARKKILSNCGGDYNNYPNKESMPIYTIILNNYDSIFENNQYLYEVLPGLVRDSSRYGIVFIITCNASNSVHGKVSSSFLNIYAFKMKDQSEYSIVFNKRIKNNLSEIYGRGLVKVDEIYEFQVANVVEQDKNIMDYIDDLLNKDNIKNMPKAKSVPKLPSNINYEMIYNNIKDINNIPIGIYKNNLKIVNYDCLYNIGNIITSNKLSYTLNFTKSLIYVTTKLNNTQVYVFDSVKKLNMNNILKDNYITKNFDEIIKQFKEYVQSLIDKKLEINYIVYIYGLDKFISSIKKEEFEQLINLIKKYEKISLFIIDDFAKIKSYVFDTWFKDIFNINNGIWIGKGIVDQNLLHLAAFTKELTIEIGNDMGYLVSDSSANIFKLIDFYDNNNEEKN